MALVALQCVAEGRPQLRTFELRSTANAAAAIVGAIELEIEADPGTLTAESFAAGLLCVRVREFV